MSKLFVQWSTIHDLTEFQKKEENDSYTNEQEDILCSSPIPLATKLSILHLYPYNKNNVPIHITDLLKISN